MCLKQNLQFIFDIIQTQDLLMQGNKNTTVVFILGGPGSGKGTQSERINKQFRFTHLSAGDLLREERKTQGSQYGQIIQKNIVQGKIVPSQITVMLLERAMKKAGLEGGRFLIDGFPRNIQNLSTWQKIMGIKVDLPFILHLECGQEVMLNRLLKRGQTSGRSDDNINSIKKRFLTYENETKEIIKYYSELNKNHNVNSEVQPDQVFEEINKIFVKHGLA